MEDNQQSFAPDFSDIPSLGDTQGLENYLNNQTLAAQGLPTQQQPAAQGQPAQPAAQGQPAQQQQGQPAAQPAAQQNPAQPAQQGNGVPQLTREQYVALLQNIDVINKRLNINTNIPGTQQTVPQQQNAGYTPQEQTFIENALKRGYNLNQINQVIMQNRAKNAGAANPQASAMDQRVAAIEEFLRSQQYLQAQNEFINRANTFATKWGLSDADLETFASEALKHGINIADSKVDMEMVFRAVYPQQYAIRSQRMSPTNASQIYGGTSIPEGSRANASKLEDAYVDNFLKGAMPNQYAASKK